MLSYRKSWFFRMDSVMFGPFWSREQAVASAKSQLGVAKFKKAGLYEKISVIEPADPFVITPVN